MSENLPPDLDEDPSAKTRTLRYTTMVFCILVTTIYVIFYNAKSQTTGRTSVVPVENPELAEKLQVDADELTDQEFVAAALAWEFERKQMQDERDAQRREIGVRKNPKFIYSAVIDQLEDNIDAIGEAQPMLQKPFLDALEELETDSPDRHPNEILF